ncbi:DNA polymerase III subunit delta' [Colwelliaceae bacterium MEBiC 14330]
MLNVCQENQLRLSRQFEQGKLPHAILIQGAEGSGKKALANWLINLLLCQRPVSSSMLAGSQIKVKHACGHCKTCLLAKSNSYPDHMLLANDNKSLGVDDIRQSNEFIQKTAHIGHAKSILIPQADMMTLAAANALLKTLEEPCANSYIVLLTNDLDAILPTVISRCSVYVIRSKVGQALLDQMNSTVNNSASNYINLSQFAELSDKDTFQAFEKFKQCYLNFLYHDEDESKLLSQLVNEKHAIRWLENITCNLIRESSQGINSAKDTLAKQKNNVDNYVKVSARMLSDIYQTTITSNKLIKSYSQTNHQFVCEKLLMTIHKIVRP